jgi:hypothetical protein
MDVSYPWDLGVPPLFPRAATLEPVAPNPVRSSAVIRYSLPIATPVSLVVYDPQGRRVATLLDRVFQDAGRQEVPVQADHLKPGVYLYRLEAGGDRQPARWSSWSRAGEQRTSLSGARGELLGGGQPTAAACLRARPARRPAGVVG